MPDLSMFANELEAADFPPGHRFFSAGDHGEIMYLVLSGEVDITLRGRVLETVKPGGVFGEMALIDHRERSAEASARTAVHVATLNQMRFLYLVRNHPYFAIEIMKVMTDRLRRSDDTI